MVESRGCLCFAKKPFLDVGPEREVGRKDLEGDPALQLPVMRLVDNAGSAAAQLALDVVAGSNGVRDAREKIVFGRRRCGQRISEAWQLV